MNRSNPAHIIERLREAFLLDLELRLRRVAAIVARLSADAADTTLLPRLKAELHDLKGTGSSFGFPEVTEIASRAETLAPDGRASCAALEGCLEELGRVLEKGRAASPGKGAAAGPKLRVTVGAPTQRSSHQG